jgi:phospholipid/cholesterol/gamma-HCH transport system substrate-binding protein
MPRTRSLAWSELKIGILAVAAIVLALVLVVAVGGQGGFFWDRYELKTKFKDVMGLKGGAVVRVAGVEVGKVTDIDFTGAEVQVTFEINKSMQSRVTTDSHAAIGSLSLLGEPVIDVTAASTGTPLKNGDFITPGKIPGSITDVANTASEGLEEITGLLKDIRAGKGNVGKIFTDEQLYKEMTALVASAEGLATYVNSGRGTLGMLAKDPKAYREMEASLANLNEMTRKIKAGEGSLGQLLNDDKLAKSLSATSGNMEQISAGLRDGKGTAGKLLTDDQLWARINTLSDRIDKLVSGLEQGEGSAGALLRDKQLYENINGTANEMKQLIADIRKDPKKFLNIRVSIW